VTRPNEFGDILTRIAGGTGLPALEVFGPQIEFLTMADDMTNNICVMRAVIPPGVTVPLHRHDDFEDFLMLSGGHEVLIERDGHLQWCEAHAGDYVRVPGARPHAHRNLSDRPAVDLIITTARMGQFFRELGRPVGAPPPTAREVVNFVATAARYGYQLGTPEENAAVGITMPAFASEDS
jgi:quercetin dioxygenase-like cupin family protein